MTKNSVLVKVTFKYFSRFLAHKKNPAQLSTPANILNNVNDIKLSGCTFRLCCNKISALTKVLEP